MLARSWIKIKDTFIKNIFFYILSSSGRVWLQSLIKWPKTYEKRLILRCKKYIKMLLIKNGENFQFSLRNIKLVGF